MLVAVVDTALNNLSHSPAQNSFVIYDDQGRTLFAYSGDLNNCKRLLTSSRLTSLPCHRHFVHRT